MHIVILMTNYIHAKKVIQNIPRIRQVLRSNSDSEVYWYPESWKKTKPDKFKLSGDTWKLAFNPQFNL